MNMLAYAIPGMALPAAAGALAARALLPAVRPYRHVEWLGCGWLIGVSWVSLMMHLAPTVAARASTLSAVAAVGLAVLALWAGRHPQFADAYPRVYPRRGVLAAAAIALGVLLLIATVVIALEVLTRPTYPWDAWSSWAYKAKAWFLTGRMPAFVSPEAWREGVAGRVYVIQGADYPTLIAGFQVYLAAWLGQWYEPLLNLPWLITFLALFGVALGESYRISGDHVVAWLAAVALASLPMLNAHVALAGYMDLWLACALLALGVAALRAFRYGGRRAWLVGAALAGVCLGLKVEGVVWVGLLVAAILIRALVRRVPSRWIAALGLVLAVLGAAGWWVAQGASLHLPYLGPADLDLAWNVGELLRVMGLSWNWHLLFYLFLPALAAGYLVHTALPDEGKLWRDFSVLGLVAMAALFAGVHGVATDFTNNSRLLLQWAPVWGLCILWILAAAAGAPRPAR